MLAPHQLGPNTWKTRDRGTHHLASSLKISKTARCCWWLVHCTRSTAPEWFILPNVIALWGGMQDKLFHVVQSKHACLATSSLSTSTSDPTDALPTTILYTLLAYAKIPLHVLQVVQWLVESIHIPLGEELEHEAKKS
jgi:hypothetical protein